MMKWQKLSDSNLPAMYQQVFLYRKPDKKHRGKQYIEAQRVETRAGDWMWFPHVSKKHVTHFMVPEPPEKEIAAAPLFEQLANSAGVRINVASRTLDNDDPKGNFLDELPQEPYPHCAYDPNIGHNED